MYPPSFWKFILFPALKFSLLLTLTLTVVATSWTGVHLLKICFLCWICWRCWTMAQSSWWSRDGAYTDEDKNSVCYFCLLISAICSHNCIMYVYVLPTPCRI